MEKVKTSQDIIQEAVEPQEKGEKETLEKSCKPESAKRCALNTLQLGSRKKGGHEGKATRQAQWSPRRLQNLRNRGAAERLRETLEQ